MQTPCLHTWIGFHANKYVDNFLLIRAKLLRIRLVPEKNIRMVSVKYAQLSAELRYEIETSDIGEKI